MKRLATSIDPRLPILIALLFTLLFPYHADAQVMVSVLEPAPRAVINEWITVSADVTSSAYELAAVRASIGPIEAPLSRTFDSRFGKVVWQATFSLKDLPKGDYNLTVRAEDVKKGASSVELAIAKDALPQIHPLSPSEGAAALSQIRGAFTCTDDDPQGCASLRLMFASDTIATCAAPDPSCVASPGVLQLDRTIDTTPYAPGPWGVTFEATDSRGQKNALLVNVYLESGDALTLAASFVGQILDVGPDRILYRAAQNPSDAAAPNTVRIYDRATGQETVVKQEDRKGGIGWLTPKGALYTSLQSAEQTQEQDLFEWRDGQTLSHGRARVNYVGVKGNYAAWSISGEGTTVHNYADGTDTPLAPNRVLEDIGPNGELLMREFEGGSSSKVTLILGKGGAEILIAHDYVEENSLTDGTNVVYRRNDNGASQRNRFITLYTPTGNVELAEGPGSVINPHERTWYQVNNGWAAWIAPSAAGGVLQVWLRNPQGVSRQVSFFGSEARLDALGPNGEVTFTSGDNLYLTSFEADTERQIASSKVRGLFLPDGLYAVLNNALFKLKGVFPAHLGDVDANGQIDVGDAVATLGMIVGLRAKTEWEATQADVNHSFTVDISDVVKILRVAVNLDPPFTGSPP